MPCWGWDWPWTLTVREEAGAEGEVSETISWMARRSLEPAVGVADADLALDLRV